MKIIHLKTHLHYSSYNAVINNVHSRDESGQMIVLMGIMLALSIFIIASLPAEIYNLNIAIPSQQSTSILPEFNHIKDSFGHSLNYNLVNLEFNQTTNLSYFYGDINDILDAFNKTKETYYILELQHGLFFDAQFNESIVWYSHMSSSGHVFCTNITLSLSDGNTYIKEDVIYSILCKEDNRG